MFQSFSFVFLLESEGLHSLEISNTLTPGDNGGIGASQKRECDRACDVSTGSSLYVIRNRLEDDILDSLDDSHVKAASICNN